MKNNLPLAGLRILNTRPLEQGKALTLSIEKAGGIAVTCPALAIVPTSDKWVNFLPDLTTVDKAIFISTNAVNLCFQALKKHHISWPQTLQGIAIGQATAKPLIKWGASIHFVPEIATSEQLLASTPMLNVSNQLVLLFKGEGGRPLIKETLVERGACLQEVNVYRRTTPPFKKQFFQSLWQDDSIDIILFTSEQALETIFALFGKEAQPWLCSKPCVVISERLAKAAANRGINIIRIARPETIINALQQFNQG